MQKQKTNAGLSTSRGLAPPILLGLSLNRGRIRIFDFQPKRRAAPAINRAELLGDNTFTAEPTSLAEYDLAVLPETLVENDTDLRAIQ